MIRLAKLQFVGPIALLVAVGAAELAAFALSRFPTSETLWYLNLAVFSGFQRSYETLCSFWGLPYAQFYLIALPTFILAVTGIVTSRRFLLALASHASFIYAGFVLYCQGSSQAHAVSASLAGVALPTNETTVLPLFLIGACCVSFLVSQVDYLLGFAGAEQRPTAASNHGSVGFVSLNAVCVSRLN